MAVAAASPAGAAGTITPWSSSVAVGKTFSVTANGCPSEETESDSSYTYQEAQLVLVTGAGAGERAAGFGQGLSDTRYRFRVPGWVDPADPAVVTGRCVRTTYTETGTGTTVSTTVVFTYPDAAIDITPGTATPTGPVFTLDRTTAAGGQVVTISGSQCQGSDYAEAVIYEGTDLSGRTAQNFLAGRGGDVAADGTFEIQLALNDRGEFEDTGGGPVAEGPYTVLAGCNVGDDEGYIFAEPQPLTVVGTNPSGSFEVHVADGQISAMGTGCVGKDVHVILDGYSSNFTVEEQATKRDRALARRSLPDAARIAIDQNGEFHETLPVTPEADGTWMVSTDAPAGSFDLTATADCGDPTADGFRYVTRYLFEDNFADLFVDRASPTSSPVGGEVALTIGGYCDGEVTAALVDRDRKVISESAPVALNDYGLATATLTAPDTAGTYYGVGTCAGETSYPEPYVVFQPKQVSATAPLADEPTEGWPSRGARETYHGKIGPITLPPMEMADGGAKALDPSGLFIPVPRPNGDFAITKMSFDLVDSKGMPVSQDDAHLHHFVITNKSKKNPACPNGTFGLPGQIVGAAGAERTVLQTGDPYGLVVKAKDDWTGVYELMSRSMSTQTVYLTYDIDYRRDVENVRPVTTYFGSATGCNSFTWTIDGSGTPDTQSTYITVAKKGRLIGAGGHIHNGGQSADWTNDRGRRLCRSEITYGDEILNHTGMDGPRSSTLAPTRVTETTAPMATTTAVGEPIPTEDFPPEFYDTDKVIEGISNCPLAESLSAGEKLRFDATYTNDRARSGVMGIYTAYVWEGGGPAAPGPGGAQPVPGNPSYTG